MTEKKEVGAPGGNQDARKHGSCSRVLDEAQKLQLDQACDVECLDAAIIEPAQGPPGRIRLRRHPADRVWLHHAAGRRPPGLPLRGRKLQCRRINMKRHCEAAGPAAICLSCVRPCGLWIALLRSSMKTDTLCISNHP